MAYIDDNNDRIAGAGKDPLKELDSELESLMAQLGALENQDEHGKTAPPAKNPEPPESERSEAPAAERVQTTVIPKTDIDSEKPLVADESSPLPEPPGRGSKSGTVIAIVFAVLFLGVAGWIAWLILSHLPSNNGKQDQTKYVSFTDSVLGDVTVKEIEDASLNTYDTTNLTKNEKGFYEYSVNGKVVSEVGVDIAEYQGEVDFGAVHESGVDFVMLRIGGRYYSAEGRLYEDSLFDAYYEQAKAAGLKVGAYFFSQAASENEAQEEARFVVEKLGGRTLDYPIAFDWETIDDDTARTDNISGGTITLMAKAFCDLIKNAGYRSVVYAGTSLMLQSYDFEVMKDYDFWLADYRDVPNMYYDFMMWQYATDGSVGGIAGDVDLNICFQPD